MGSKIIGFISIAVGIGLIVVFTTASAIELSKVHTGSTVYSYEDTSGDIVAETYLPLSFKAKQGFDNYGFTFVSNGRLRKDFASDNDSQGKLYDGYLQFDGFNKMLRTKLGRQYISKGGNTGTIDGISIDFGQSKKWATNISVGSTVSNRFGKFDTDKMTENYLYSVHGGVAVPIVPFDIWLTAGFSSNKTNNITDKQTISFEAKEKPLKMLTLNQELHWDYMNERLSYHKYTMRLKPIKPLKLHASFKYSEPTVSTLSILRFFASDAHQVLRAGGEYGINDWISLSTQYTTTLKQLNTSNRIKVGLSNNFDYFSAYYGGMYGKATDTYYGGFLKTDFPLPFPFIKNLGLGTITNYTRYLIEGLPEDVYEDALTVDIYGDYKIHKILGTTFGIQTLRNRVKKYDVRGYLKVDLTI